MTRRPARRRKITFPGLQTQDGRCTIRRRQPNTHVRTTLFSRNGEASCMGRCFDLSPAAEGWLLGYARLSLCSLDQTTGDLLAALHPHRPWEKQVPAHRRKCALTPTTHRSEATGETANVHQGRSHPSRPAGQVGSSLAAEPVDRATRDEARAGIGSSFACTGNASQRLVLTSRRSLRKRSP